MPFGQIIEPKGKEGLIGSGNYIAGATIDPEAIWECSEESLIINSGTVEKAPQQIFGWDAEKNDLTECATINDLIIGRGYETPKNHP